VTDGALRVGSIEIVAALAAFAVFAAAPRLRGIREAEPSAPAQVRLEIAERGSNRWFEGICPVSIGRSSRNDLLLLDPEVSRYHARLDSQAGMVYVTDAGSSNGTFLNGHRIEGAAEVHRGDTIDVGTTRLTFLGQKQWH
jgi:pSer/pThr/pTyr-binding forkhead associated (FHA) protein